MLAGESPYSVDIFYAAPWGLIPLIPFALLPYPIGRALLFLVSLLAFAYTARHFGAGRFTLLLFLFSAAVVGCLNNGNIVWLPLLGAILPPQYGLILLAIKPQVGIGLGLYWCVTIWRKDGFWAMIRIFTPVLTLIALSVMMYGFWFLRFGLTLERSRDNMSLGWSGVLIGVILLMQAIRTGEKAGALASAPLLSPYVLQFTWAALLVPFLKCPRCSTILFILLWIPVLWRIFT
jgi:hypothetical protein